MRWRDLGKIKNKIKSSSVQIEKRKMRENATYLLTYLPTYLLHTAIDIAQPSPA